MVEKIKRYLEPEPAEVERQETSDDPLQYLPASLQHFVDDSFKNDNGDEVEKYINIKLKASEAKFNLFDWWW